MASCRGASYLLVGSPNDVTYERCLATQAYDLADLIWNGHWDAANPTHEGGRLPSCAHPEWMEFLIAVDEAID